MKSLYLILRKGSNQTTFGLLKKSAEERGINVKPIYIEDFDATDNITLTEDDALYRISSDPLSSAIEKVLINENLISFYSSYTDCIREDFLGSPLMNSKANLQIVPTIFTLPQNSNQIMKYAESLGGFPIILKALGGMQGVGVMKVDSTDSLSSILDFLKRKSDIIIMRKFIKHTEQARLIVVGDEVVACSTNVVSKDFRTNAGNHSTREHTVKEYSEEVKKMAVKAVESLGYEFGGVDILFEENTNNPYIAEVNLPCFFPLTQRLTNVDISGQMVDFLINKSKSKVVAK